MLAYIPYMDPMGYITEMSSSVGIIVPNIWKNEKWSKPATSIIMG